MHTPPDTDPREQAARLLAHALPPSARHPRFARTFTKAQRGDLARLGCTDAQVERLARILPAIARYDAQGPSLAAARAPLRKLAAEAHKAAAALRVVLDAHDEATQESRTRLLQALAALQPARCEADPERTSLRKRHDGREVEARRLLAAVQDVEQAAQHAIECMPTAQSRAVAHPFPVGLIAAALDVDGPQVPCSASAGSPFRRIASVCYQAAGVAREPVRAIREHLKACNGRPEK